MTWLLLASLWTLPGAVVRVGFDTYGACQQAVAGLEQAELGAALCVPVALGQDV